MINIYSEKEIEVMRQGGGILAKIMKQLIKEVKPDIATEYLNKVAEDLIFSYGAEPAFKGYNGYPSALCASLNEQIVHGIPSQRVLEKGDVLTLDLGIKYRGFYTDSAITIAIGKIDKKTKKLISVTKKALEIGIKKAKPGNYLEDISLVIQKHAEKNGFNAVRELCGHGIGKHLHEDPQVLNYIGEAPLSNGLKLKPGMVLALEPMVVMGDWRIEKSDDGFTYKSIDNSVSAHFEHTIAITKKGAKILTK
jgi:methionyl aminopeptidase